MGRKTISRFHFCPMQSINQSDAFTGGSTIEITALASIIQNNDDDDDEYSHALSIRIQEEPALALDRQGAASLRQDSFFSLFRLVCLFVNAVVVLAC
jgi:hypothetical protein